MNNTTNNQSKSLEVSIPAETFELVSYTQDKLPAAATINTSLIDFEPKQIFGWHCSVVIKMSDINEQNLPTKKELDTLKQFENTLTEKIKGNNADKPNALFFARIVCNGSCELIWRVYNPHVVNDYLTSLIDSKDYPREFNYQIDPDQNWELTQEHLSAVKAFLDEEEKRET